MVNKLKRRLRGERGSVMPLVVVLMFAMLGISAFAIDLGLAPDFFAAKF